MKLRAIIETGILVIFLVAALVVILRHNAPASMENGRSTGEYVQSGNQLYAAGETKFSKAAIQYWEALKRNPDMVDAHLKLAAIYYGKVWNYEALRELAEVERIDPEYPGLHLLLGKVYRELPDSEDKAFEALRRAAVLQPENSEAHYYLGTAYQQRGMQEQAISEYEKASGEWRAYLQLGRIYKKEQEKAEVELKNALGIKPASEEVIAELRSLYKHQAESYENKGEYDKAAEKYGEILKLDPDNIRNVGIYMKLGDRYYSEGLYDKAGVMYRAAFKLDPMNLSIFMALRAVDMTEE